VMRIMEVALGSNWYLISTICTMIVPNVLNGKYFSQLFFGGSLVGATALMLGTSCGPTYT
jgi:hypothetical protein